ncbi:MAG TPA: ATP synthase F1 subunit delta [Blastocatellia bacterium]
MSVIAVARRYAEALADVAEKHDQVEQIDANLRLFSGMIESSRELRETLASPIISLRDKRRVVDALIDRVLPDHKTTTLKESEAGRVRAETLTANLLRTMLSHYRLHHLPEVYEQYQREMNKRKGLIIAEVITAAEVGSAEQKKLGRTLEKRTGKKVEFKFKTDPSLVGGLVTRVGSVVYDGSVRTQLQEIKQRLKRGESP